MKEKIIEVQQLTKYFPIANRCQDVHIILNNISLDVYVKDIYGIIGPSGAGKSTLIRCLTGLDSPNSGSILIDGKNIVGDEIQLGKMRRQAGMIFQHFHLFSSYTVAANIKYPLAIQGMNIYQQNNRVEELLTLVGLESKKNVYPSQLSGGEKQRVGIARALAHQPKILFCDEPTSALDPRTTHSILDLLLKLNQTLDLTIVMVTHQLEAVKQICNTVAVLSHGQMIEEGPVEKLFIDPIQAITRQLLQFESSYLPYELRSHCSKNTKRVRLGFEGFQAREPIISQLVKNFDIEANILSGKIDHLKHTVIGNLIVELSGLPLEIEKALHHLHQQNVYCEVISYDT